MRITATVPSSSQKVNLFTDLVSECQLAAPGSRLSEKLKRKMEGFAKDDRKDVVGQTTNDGCAPLFLACRNGSADVVEYLITTCGADIEQRGQFDVIDEGVSHSVTPLWCAAVSGRLAVVKVLIRNGANVDAVSDSGSTPIRSTCYIVRGDNNNNPNPSSHFDIVKCLVRAGADIGQPNHFGGTCLINSVQSPELVKYLLAHGKNLNVNAEDVQHKTALHYAIQENRLESTKILLKAGADPFRLSKYGDDALQTACLKGALMIFNHLLETVVYDPPRIADAFELIGSTFLLDLHDVGSTMFFWRKALEIRHEGAYRNYPKPPRIMHPVLKVREVDSREELDDINGDLIGLKNQALLISERILGPTHKDTVFRFMYAGASHADTNEYRPCVALWNHALNLKIQKETLLSCDTSFTARAIVQLYINILSKSPVPQNLMDEDDFDEFRDIPIEFKDVLATAKHINDGMRETINLLAIQPQFKAHLDNFDVILTSWVHLLHILLRLARSQEEMEAVYKIVDQVLTMNPISQHGDTLLHLAVASSSMLKSNSFLDGGVEGLDDERMNEQQECILRPPLFPSASVASFVLSCGYDVHARNDMQETPLHIASRCENFSADVADLLLRHGAHLDAPDLRDICPRDILIAHACKINIMPYVTLKCLAANTILQERVPFSKDDMPECMYELVQMHLCNLPNSSHTDLVNKMDVY